MLEVKEARYFGKASICSPQTMVQATGKESDSSSCSRKGKSSRENTTWQEATNKCRKASNQKIVSLFQVGNMPVPHDEFQDVMNRKTDDSVRRSSFLCWVSELEAKVFNEGRANQARNGRIRNEPSTFKVSPRLNSAEAMDNGPQASGISDEYNNLQTWPKAQLNCRALNELNQWIQVENVIDSAKKYVKNDNKKTVKDADARELIQNLCEHLERVRGDLNVTSNSRRNSDCNSLSMIICDVSREGISADPPSPANGYAPQLGSSPAPLQGLDSGGAMPSTLANVNSQLTESVADPAFIRAIPHFTIISFAVLWLCAGAWIFQLLDPEIAARPFRNALLFTFQLSATIGWGDTKATNKWSQAFCVVYTIFSVPIVFSAFANMGRLISEFYCVDWLFLTAVVRRRIKEFKDRLFPKIPEEDNFRTAQIRRRLPIKAAVNLLVIATIYFSITSMATIGLGDYHPDPENLLETIVCIVYLSSGIIILSALCLSIAYHFQRMHYVVLKEWLHLLYVYYKQKRESEQKNKVVDSNQAIMRSQMMQGFAENGGN
uniref:Potassium channel domain-containing protein n=1 Tax=Ditylenchus dipsaci TaxID=166011 RepID=A0A915DQ05_9BILA